MIDWLSTSASTCGAEHLTVGGFENDHVRIDLLDEFGFGKQDTYLCHMDSQLQNPPLPMQVPEGYAVREMMDDDIPGLAVTIAAAFGSQPKPDATYQALRGTEGFRTELAQLVVTHEGDVAAFCIGWLDPRHGVGLLEPVGCHPSHRRQGLATAAANATLNEFVAMGSSRAVVYPHGDDQSARDFYARLGFGVIANDWDWKRDLPD